MFEAGIEATAWARTSTLRLRLRLRHLSRRPLYHFTLSAADEASILDVYYRHRRIFDFKISSRYRDTVIVSIKNWYWPITTTHEMPVSRDQRVVYNMAEEGEVSCFNKEFWRNYSDLIHSVMLFI